MKGIKYFDIFNDIACKYVKKGKCRKKKKMYKQM